MVLKLMLTIPPSFKMPPPLRWAWLPLIVLLVISKSPELEIPAPQGASLSLSVLLTICRLPLAKLVIPPPPLAAKPAAKAMLSWMVELTIHREPEFEIPPPAVPPELSLITEFEMVTLVCSNICIAPPEPKGKPPPEAPFRIVRSRNLTEMSFCAALAPDSPT